MHYRFLVPLLAALAAVGPASAARKPSAPAQSPIISTVQPLTDAECERLGGEIEVVGSRKCMTRMMCTVKKADGTVFKSCIDELS